MEQKARPPEEALRLSYRAQVGAVNHTQPSIRFSRVAICPSTLHDDVVFGLIYF